jgi:Cu+-exporting ATPase
MLLRRKCLFVPVAAILVLAATHFLWADEARSVATVVTIQGEMCGGCVKKIKLALADIPGIAQVEGDSKTQTITIVPAPEIDLSPLAIWEAVEKAGKKPVKLAGPHGMFKSKPKS